MESFLQIIGSIASIGSIPLALFLYLRSREAKFYKTVREIVKILSYQIGEGRSLSVFEIQSVISSKLRESRIKSNAIEVGYVIEDLVAETISSPMLDSERKKEIISNLRTIHKNRDVEIFNKDSILQKIKPTVDSEDEITEKYDKVFSNTKENIESVNKKIMRFNYVSKLSSELFAVISIFITTIVFFITTFRKNEIQESFSTFLTENIEIFKIGLGFIITIMAGFLTYFINSFLNKKRREQK